MSPQVSRLEHIEKGEFSNGVDMIIFWAFVLLFDTFYFIKYLFTHTHIYMYDSFICSYLMGSSFDLQSEPGSFHAITSTADSSLTTNDIFSLLLSVPCFRS